MHDDGRAPHALVAARAPETVADLTYALARAGITVASAASAAEAWIAVHERPPDVLFAGRLLAAAPPFGLLDRVRRDPTVRHVGVVVVREPGDERTRLAEGDAHVDDPRDEAKVLEAATTVLRAVRARSGGEAVTAECPIALVGLMNEVVVRDARLAVSPSELALLRLLIEHPRGLPDATIQEALWGRRPRARFRGLVSVAHRLRRKLEPFGVQLRRTTGFPGYAVRW